MPRRFPLPLVLEQLASALPLTSTVSSAQFYAVPADAPRWLLPPDSRRLTVVLTAWRPYRVSSYALWTAIRLASRAGVLACLPGKRLFRLPSAAAIDWQALGWRHSEPPVFAVYIGTPGPTQKAVLHLVNRGTERCEAVVKVPLTVGACDAICREAVTLAALAEQAICAAPHLLQLDRQRAIATLSFIEGRPGDRRLRPEYLDLLRSLVNKAKFQSLASHFAADRDALAEQFHRQDLPLVHALLEELADDTALPACWVHGDFAPWNIRCRPNQPPALIDWEEAEPCGLPLQDAFHFLNMQDYVFGHKPASHARALLPFADTLGLTPDQCRRLELAYLTRAYLRSQKAANVARSEFLIRTLRTLLCDNRQASFIGIPPEHSPAPQSGASPAQGRTELFRSVIATLNAASISYCVLSGDDAIGSKPSSDIDLMVSTNDWPQVPALLARAASSVSAHLLQAIQHETTATYFVLARAENGALASLAVDCYSDYRRDSRTWLRAHDVLAQRRAYRDYFVPAVTDEFAYYLIKKVLKQCITAQQLKRLHELLALAPPGCLEVLARLWPGAARSLRRAIASQDLPALVRLLPAMRYDLVRTHPVQGPVARIAGAFQELARCLRRLLRPTGLYVDLRGGDHGQPMQLAGELRRRLGPCFRYTAQVGTPKNTTALLAAACKIVVGRIRSTLVISCNATSQKHVRSSLSAWLLRPDAIVAMPNGLRLSAGSTNVDVEPLDDANLEQAIATASARILDCLAARTARRLKLPDGSADLVTSTNPAHLSPAGWD